MIVRRIDAEKGDPMNLSEAKSFDTDQFEYDRAHREVSAAEQARPCTCQIKARKRLGGTGYPALIDKQDADPDCELHFPWQIEDDDERIAALRWWFAGYHVGYNTATDTATYPDHAKQLLHMGFEVVEDPNA